MQVVRGNSSGLVALTASALTIIMHPFTQGRAADVRFCADDHLVAFMMPQSADPMSPQSTTQAGDVSWLAEVTTVPKFVPHERLGKLAPLLLDESGETISTREAWQRQRKTVRKAWLEFLGPMPDPRPVVKLQVLKTEKIGETIRQLVRYEGEPGILVEGYLLLPDSAEQPVRSR